MEQNLLEQESDYFDTIRMELLAKAPGDYALIRGRELVGVFKCEEDALRRGYQLYGNSPFLVKEIVEFDEVLDFTHNFLISA